MSRRDCGNSWGGAGHITGEREGESREPSRSDPGGDPGARPAGQLPGIPLQQRVGILPFGRHRPRAGDPPGPAAAEGAVSWRTRFDTWREQARGPWWLAVLALLTLAFATARLLVPHRGPSW